MANQIATNTQLPSGPTRLNFSPSRCLRVCSWLRKSDSETGSGAVAVEQVGLTAMTQVTGRAQPIEITDTPADRRWVYPTKGFVADLVDTYEKLEIQIDPQGSIARAQVAACNRFKDDTWIATLQRQCLLRATRHRPRAMRRPTPSPSPPARSSPARWVPVVVQRRSA